MDVPNLGLFFAQLDPFFCEWTFKPNLVKVFGIIDPDHHLAQKELSSRTSYRVTIAKNGEI